MCVRMNACMYLCISLSLFLYIYIYVYINMSVCNAILLPAMCRLQTSTVGKPEGSTIPFYNQHGMHRRPGLRGQHAAH